MARENAWLASRSILEPRRLGTRSYRAWMPCPRLCPDRVEKRGHAMREPLKVLDLFSGIGGFSLGLERTGGFKTVAFCEIEEFPRRVLAKHWPGVPIHQDVRELRAEHVGAADVICGGYPCQPFSLAGKRGGAEDDRHLWPEMRRLVDELRPAWVIGENVAGHISMGLDDVLSDLASLGYAARAFAVPALAIGAPHRRERLWIVAHAARLQSGRQDQRTIGERVGAGGEPFAMADRASVGRGARRTRRPHPGGAREREQALQDVADAASVAQREQANKANSVSACGDTRVELGCGSWWEFEPDVGRVAHGVPARVDRLRALGNAVVPQVVEAIGRRILEAEGLT